MSCYSDKIKSGSVISVSDTSVPLDSNPQVLDTNIPDTETGSSTGLPDGLGELPDIDVSADVPIDTFNGELDSAAAPDSSSPDSLIIEDGIPRTTCGDGNLDEYEECDGEVPPGNTCQSLGFDKGILACAIDCSLDTHGCAYFTCGDGEIDPGEECDGNCLAWYIDGDPCTDDTPAACSCSHADVGLVDNDGCCHTGDDACIDADCPSPVPGSQCSIDLDGDGYGCGCFDELTNDLKPDNDDTDPLCWSGWCCQGASCCFEWPEDELCEFMSCIDNDGDGYGEGCGWVQALIDPTGQLDITFDIRHHYDYDDADPTIHLTPECLSNDYDQDEFGEGCAVGEDCNEYCDDQPDPDGECPDPNCYGEEYYICGCPCCGDDGMKSPYDKDMDGYFKFYSTPKCTNGCDDWDCWPWGIPCCDPLFPVTQDCDDGNPFESIDCETPCIDDDMDGWYAGCDSYVQCIEWDPDSLWPDWYPNGNIPPSPPNPTCIEYGKGIQADNEIWSPDPDDSDPSIPGLDGVDVDYDHRLDEYDDACPYNPYAWTADACSQCVDHDQDGFFAGCDRYQRRGIDADGDGLDDTIAVLNAQVYDDGTPVFYSPSEAGPIYKEHSTESSYYPFEYMLFEDCDDSNASLWVDCGTEP